MQIQGGAGLSIALIVSISKLCIPAHGFLHLNLMNARASRSVMQRLAAEEEGSKNQHRWKHEPFDFSSKYGWDKFYKNGLNTDSVEAPDFGDDKEIESLEYEWHPHIPHSQIVDAIEPAISAAASASKDHLPSILLVGTGNSKLPRILHDAFDTPVRVTCLDYSPVCIDMIKSMYESSCPNMNFVVGDATNLQEVMWEEDNENQSAKGMHFDVIVDKGLLDALMCGEGFDLEKLMVSTNDVLTPHDWGMHVLICFQLSRSSQQSLVDLGSKHGPGLLWDFNLPVEGSENGRACFNLARRYRSQDTNVFGIDQITTQWME